MVTKRRLVAPQLGSCASSWRGRKARRPDTAWKVRASRRFRRCSPSRRTSPAALSLAETRSCPRPRQPPNRWPRRSRALVADSWRSGLVPLLLMQMPHLWGREMSDPSAPITNGAHWAARSPPAPTHLLYEPCSVPRIKYVIGNLVGVGLTTIQPVSGNPSAELFDLLIATWSLTLTGAIRRRVTKPRRASSYLSPRVAPRHGHWNYRRADGCERPCGHRRGDPAGPQAPEAQGEAQGQETCRFQRRGQRGGAGARGGRLACWR